MNVGTRSVGSWDRPRALRRTRVALGRHNSGVHETDPAEAHEGLADAENAVYVGRPTRWGNPFVVGKPHPVTGRQIVDRAQAVELYRLSLVSGLVDTTSADLMQLRGHDLACWCPLDQPCHADALIEWITVSAPWSPGGALLDQLR